MADGRRRRLYEHVGLGGDWSREPEGCDEEVREMGVMERKTRCVGRGGAGQLHNLEPPPVRPFQRGAVPPPRFMGFGFQEQRHW